MSVEWAEVRPGRWELRSRYYTKSRAPSPISYRAIYGALRRETPPDLGWQVRAYGKALDTVTLPASLSLEEAQAAAKMLLMTGRP